MTAFPTNPHLSKSTRCIVGLLMDLKVDGSIRTPGCLDGIEMMCMLILRGSFMSGPGTADSSVNY